MSQSGYPQGPNPYSSYPQNSNSPQPPNCGAPYPPNSAPYPSQGGVFAPSLGLNVGSPMYMPQPFAGSGYPSSTTGASYVGSPYPQSSPYPGCHSQPYPQSAPHGQGQGYPQTSSYPSGHGQAYPQTSSYPYPQTSSYPYPQTSSCPSHGQSYPQSSYPGTHGEHGGTSSYPSSHSSSHAAHVVKKSPTVVPIQPFDPRADAEVLRKAMKGFGTDEKTIINVLTKRSNAQRLEIALQFKTLYGKDLIKELKGELSGNFERVIVALMTPLPQYYAKELHDAISGLGTHETTLIEVMCSLSNAEIRTIREAYQKTYHKNLESDLKGDTGGHFRRIMMALCSAGRDESMETSRQAAAADAITLYEAGEKKWGTDESAFNMVLCQRNYAQLKLVFEEYQRISKHDIEKAIKSEFSGDIEDALLAVVRAIKNQQAFFAQRIHGSIKGMGTNDRDLIRLVVTRCEIDMGDIKREYQANHKESLAAAIKGDCSGDYKKCLLALIGESQ